MNLFIYLLFVVLLCSHDFASNSVACQHAGQEPSAEAPQPGSEHVEDLAPSHEPVWAPRPEIFQEHMIPMVKALRRSSMLVIPTMPIHVPFHPGVFYILDNFG